MAFKEVYTCPYCRGGHYKGNRKFCLVWRSKEAQEWWRKNQPKLKVKE